MIRRMVNPKFAVWAGRLKTRRANLLVQFEGQELMVYCQSEVQQADSGKLLCQFQFKVGQAGDPGGPVMHVKSEGHLLGNPSRVVPVPGGHCREEGSLSLLCVCDTQ